jgi:hypothetical protein
MTTASIELDGATVTVSSRMAIREATQSFIIESAEEHRRLLLDARAGGSDPGGSGLPALV